MLPLIVYDVGDFRLKDKWQLLDELKCKLEDVLQLKRLSMSRCNSCSPGGVLMCLKHLVSSAKSKASLSVIELGRSFINMIVIDVSLAGSNRFRIFGHCVLC